MASPSSPRRLAVHLLTALALAQGTLAQARGETIGYIVDAKGEIITATPVACSDPDASVFSHPIAMYCDRAPVTIPVLCSNDGLVYISSPDIETLRFMSW